MSLAGTPALVAEDDGDDLSGSLADTSPSITGRFKPVIAAGGGHSSQTWRGTKGDDPTCEAGVTPDFVPHFLKPTDTGSLTSLGGVAPTLVYRSPVQQISP